MQEKGKHISMYGLLQLRRVSYDNFKLGASFY